MYTYYIKVESHEHFLTCTELARIYGIYSVKEQPKPHSRFVAAIMSEYYRQHPNENTIHYQTKQGLMQVYPASVYVPLLEKLVIENPKDTECCYTTDKGKKHYYQILLNKNN